jgi:hypothetical protein
MGPMKRLSRVHLKVLDVANDVTSLWELAVSWTDILDETIPGTDLAQTVEVHPETPLRHTRKAVEELLRSGYVRLYNQKRRRHLDLDEALAIVSDDSAWVPQETHITVETTDTGSAALREAWPRFFGEGTEPTVW